MPVIKDIEARLNDLHAQFNRDSLTARDANGKEIEIGLGKVVHAYQPNAMGTFTKIGFYFSKVWEFLSDDPREANTEGGIFPAIFGTVMMTLIMAMIVTPFGVLAAVYLREYAKQNALTRHDPYRGEQPGGRSGHRLRRVRSGLLRLRVGRLARPTVLP
jgi:phosphate transport system permease protein